VSLTGNENRLSFVAMRIMPDLGPVSLGIVVGEL